MPKNSKGKEIVEILVDKCIVCQVCIAECPTAAIILEGGTIKLDPEACIGCGKCVDVCPADCILFEKPRKKKVVAAKKLTDYQGIAVFIEARDGVGADVSWELVGKARELAQKLNTQVMGLLLGRGTEPVAREAIAYGCDRVYQIDHPLLEVYRSRVYGQALTQLCEEVRPAIVLLGATPLGRDLAGVVATHLQTGLTADCTGLDIDSEQLLLMTRPTFGGNIMATIRCRNYRPQMSTVRPRVMPLPQKEPERRGEIRTIDFEAPTDGLPQIVEFIPRATEGGMDIAKADALVVVGKGACDAKNLPLLEEFARMMGGTIACSRPVVQSGLLPYSRQVGQTGKTVAPKLYIGVAVSGAVQHLAGMQGSKKIIAINTDRHAPLMQIADYAIVGDYLEVVPKLMKEMEARIRGTGAKVSQP